MTIKRGDFVTVKKGNLIYTDLVTVYNNKLWLIQTHNYLENESNSIRGALSVPNITIQNN